MQQFTIPQFIDVEDKIIGPITTRQFIIILAGFLLMAICYKLFDFSLFITVGLFILVIIIIFAFVRINGRPFHFFLLNLIQTLKKPSLRVWNHLLKEIEITDEISQSALEIRPPSEPKHYTASRLAELSLMVDTKGAYKGEGGEKTEISSAEGGSAPGGNY